MNKTQALERRLTTQPGDLRRVEPSKQVKDEAHADELEDEPKAD